MRLVQQFELTREFLLIGPDPNPFAWAPLPPYPWFVQRPRGGVWVATGAIERTTGEGDFIRDTVVVIDRSDGAKYVRPGSRLYREWQAST